MNPLSQTVLQTRAFQSWRLVLMAVILLAATTTSGLYIGTIQAQGSRGAITVQAQISRGAITGLTLSSDTPGTLTLSWDAASPTPTDYRVDWAKSDEDYQSWKVDEGHKYRARTATSVTIADLDHDTEYRVRIRARYYRGEHEANPWGGPWAEATLQVKGNPQPEQAEEPPEPDRPPPAANVAKEKEPSLIRQVRQDPQDPMVTWTEIPHTGKEIDGKFYKHIEDTQFLMVWDADTETGPRLPAYEVQFAQCNSTAGAAITYEHTEPVNGLFKIRHRTTTTDPAWERAYPPTDNDRWQIYSGTECDTNPEHIVSAIWNNQNVIYLRHQYSNILEAHTITDYANPATKENRAPQLDIPLKIGHRHISSFAQGIGLGPDPTKPNILYILVGNRGPLQPYDIDTQQPDAVEPSIDPGISSISILIDFHFVSNQPPAVGYFTHNNQELYIYKRTFTKTTSSTGTTYTPGQLQTVSIGARSGAQSLTGFDSIILAASHQASDIFTGNASANDTELEAAFPQRSVLPLISACGSCGIRVSTYDGLVLYAANSNGKIIAIVSNSGEINQAAFNLPENAGPGHTLDNFFTVNTTYPPSTSTFTSTDTSTSHHECFELESQGSTQQVITYKGGKPQTSPL